MTSLIAIGPAAVGGSAIAPFLVRLGLRQLDPASPPGRRLLIQAAAAGAASGVSAAAATHRAGSWWWLPALFVWAIVLGSVAVCDARARRVPTPMTQAAAFNVSALVLVAAAGSLDVRGLVVSAVAAASAALILGVCWRFMGAGFGDVRLAALGGLGLGHVTVLSLGYGVSIFAIVIIGHAIVTLRRTHDWSAHVALGPALAIGFLLAAAA